MKTPERRRTIRNGQPNLTERNEIAVTDLINKITQDINPELATLAWDNFLKRFYLDQTESGLENAKQLLVKELYESSEDYSEYPDVPSLTKNHEKSINELVDYLTGGLNPLRADTARLIVRNETELEDWIENARKLDMKFESVADPETTPEGLINWLRETRADIIRWKQPNKQPTREIIDKVDTIIKSIDYIINDVSSREKILKDEAVARMQLIMRAKAQLKQMLIDQDYKDKGY